MTTALNFNKEFFFQVLTINLYPSPNWAKPVIITVFNFYTLFNFHKSRSDKFYFKVVSILEHRNVTYFTNMSYKNWKMMDGITVLPSPAEPPILFVEYVNVSIIKTRNFLFFFFTQKNDGNFQKCLRTSTRVNNTYKHKFLRFKTLFKIASALRIIKRLLVFKTKRLEKIDRSVYSARLNSCWMHICYDNDLHVYSYVNANDNRQKRYYRYAHIINIFFEGLFLLFLKNDLLVYRRGENSLWYFFLKHVGLIEITCITRTVKAAGKSTNRFNSASLS